MARGDDTGGMGGGALPSSHATRKNGIAHPVPTAKVACEGAAVRHASRRFRDQDPQSRTRGEVLGVEVAVGHAVAQHVVARHRAHSSPGRADQRRLELGRAVNARGWSGASRRSGRFPGQRPRTTGDRLPRAPPWSASTTYRWSMSRVGVTWPRSDSTRRHASDGRRPERGAASRTLAPSFHPGGVCPADGERLRARTGKEAHGSTRTV
jgi:hypothetical protein